ncbi:hypothetical protein KUCAC02_029819 [Chaenocephalus aceratus]|nr:hypothetical protein KUCAC02_029819 [Chaenocephalus aceratus]
MVPLTRGTVKTTAPIAELRIVDPDTFETLTFDPAIDALLSLAKKCATHVTVDNKANREDMKAKGKRLPSLTKYQRAGLIGLDKISSLTYSTRSNTSLRRYRSPPADIRRLAIGRGKVTVVHQRRVLDTPLMHRCVRSHGSASGEKREDLST